MIQIVCSSVTRANQSVCTGYLVSLDDGNRRIFENSVKIYVEYLDAGL